MIGVLIRAIPGAVGEDRDARISIEIKGVCIFECSPRAQQNCVGDISIDKCGSADKGRERTQ